MDLKTLARQHEAFANRQAVKAARAQAKAEKERQWVLTKEAWRKKRERRERATDLAQQRRLEDDPEYL